MNKETRAILLLFNGTEPTTEVVSMLTAPLMNLGAENADVMAFNAKEIANLILARNNSAKIIKFDKKNENDFNAEENATIFIGTVMKDLLSDSNTDNGDIAEGILQKIISCRKSRKEQDKEFMNALFILSMDDLNISSTLMRKYNLTPERIGIIKKMYNLAQKL